MVHFCLYLCFGKVRKPLLGDSGFSYTHVVFGHRVEGFLYFLNRHKKNGLKNSSKSKDVFMGLKDV